MPALHLTAIIAVIGTALACVAVELEALAVALEGWGRA